MRYYTSHHNNSTKMYSNFDLPSPSVVASAARALDGDVTSVVGVRASEGVAVGDNFTSVMRRIDVEVQAKG